MASTALTQGEIDALRPRAKPYKVSDGGGLHLLVTPNGSLLWRLSYRFGGKQKTLALGSYNRDTYGLIEARAKREAAKLTLKAGLDPAGGAMVTDGQATFEQVARAWHEHNSHRWSEKYASIVMGRLEDYVFPLIGRRALKAVKRSDVLAVLREIEGRGILDTAHRVKQYIGGVFRFSDDDTVTDPTPMLKGRLKTPPRVQHHKSLKAAEIGPFLVKLDADTAEPQTRLAILLTILTAARTAELIGARWEEFEQLRYPKKALWRVPAERMKRRVEHLVPLSRQALDALDELHKVTGRGEYLFPARSGRGTMSNNTMIFRLYALGYRNKSTMHGFRGSFSTIANESGLWAPDVIELQLAHAEGDAVRAAYNSAEHLPKRRELMTWWGEQIETMRKKARQDQRIQHFLEN
jgi:integrase